MTFKNRYGATVGVGIAIVLAAALVSGTAAPNAQVKPNPGARVVVLVHGAQAGGK